MKRTAILILACLLTICGLARPAGADGDGSNWHRPPSKPDPVRVETRDDGATVITIPADGQTYTVGGYTLRAEAASAIIVTVCNWVIFKPYFQSYSGWPSIMLAGGVNCYDELTGVPAYMTRVDANMTLSQFSGGYKDVPGSLRSFHWGPGTVVTMWAVPAATCVAAYQSMSLKQFVYRVAVDAYGNMATGYLASPFAVISGCKRFFP